MKSLSKSDKFRSFIAPKMTDLIAFLDSNIKSAVYTGGDIHGIYCYLDMIGGPTTLTNSGQFSHHFSPSYSTNNDKSYIQPVIADLRMRQKSICKLCGISGNKSDACIICGPKFFPPSLKRNMNQFNALHSE